MREYATPQLAEVEASSTLLDALRERAQSSPHDVLFSRRVAGRWQPVTTKEFATEVTRLAAGLVASGVQPGDRVGLMSKTRYEWTLCDYAIWTAGAVTVPIYETSSAEQVQWNLGDSGAVAFVCETPTHQGLFDSVQDQLPDVQHVWQIDGGGLDELGAAGTDVPASALDERRLTLGADSLATLIYTSGTTGRPKGCELTHRNLLMVCRAARASVPDVFEGDNSTLLFLPLAHVFARFVQVACVESGIRIGHSSDIKNLLADFAGFQPTFILAVPRVFEKVYNTAKQKAHAEGKGKVFDYAERISIEWSEKSERGKPGFLLNAQHSAFDKLVYSKLRAAMGGKVRYAVSGGAPLGARLGHFFRGLGLTVLEGYGLTETSAPATVNIPGAIKIGTVGRPIPGVTIRIADDGEILIQGANVFTGYWQNEAATNEVKDGSWFHSGDLGELDAEGFLKITGRKKELIVTAGGKNVAPAVLEDRLRAHPLVDQCMVVGDQKPFIGCLVTLDREALQPWATGRGKAFDIAQLVHDPDLIAEIQGGVDEANKAVSKAEAIRKFTILAAEWTEEGGQLTPSLKLKRNVVMKEAATDVEALYAGGAT